MTLESEMGLAKWSILDFVLTIFLQSSVRTTVQNGGWEKYQALRRLVLSECELPCIRTPRPEWPQHLGCSIQFES